MNNQPILDTKWLEAGKAWLEENMAKLFEFRKPVKFWYCGKYYELKEQKDD